MTNTEASQRPMGISIMGDVPWGTHLCQFYRTPEDLLDILVSYFQAGLESNEFCMWVTSEPLDERAAEAAIRQAVPNFDRYREKGQIEILPYSQWYVQDGIFNQQRVLDGWVSKHNQALAQGFAGLRLTGNTFWLEPTLWGSFTEYEAQINSVIGQYKMIALCTYSLDKCEISEILDVISNHQFALIKDKGRWRLIESSERRQALEEIGRLNQTLRRRARDLEAANAELQREIGERKRAEERIEKLNHELEQHMEELQSINVQLEETLSHEQIARAQAEEGQRFLQSIMQYAPEGILIADAPDGNVRFVSRYAIEMIGRPASDLLGIPGQAHPVRQILFLPDGKTPIPFGDMPITRASSRGEIVLDQELVLQRANGDMRTILTSAGPIHDKSGNITGAIAMWRDITERKQIEQQVERLNRDLGQHAQDLEMANKELESFSYSISHDLRTPLAAIQGFASALLKDYGDLLPSDARPLCKLIYDNSTEMTQLVEGLLRFSRFVREPLHRQSVDLSQLARQALENLHSQQEGRRVEIVIGELPPCQGDPVLLKQVLVNLLSNALKFTRSREVARIEIGSKSPIGLGSKPETVYFIRDNGVGFEPSQAEKLFGVFQRLHRQEDYEGTGVGLAIVDRIIRRHGGRVYADGAVDQGATFYFTVPD